MPTATQGVKPQQLIDAFAKLLQRATGLPDNFIILWCEPGRPNPEGQEVIVWFRPAGEKIDADGGAVRYGNKFTPGFEVNLTTRYFGDGSQRDTYKLPPHFVYRWQLIDAIQNENLFPDYVALTDPPPAVWAMPVPVTGAVPLTTGTMLVGDINGEVKDQYEEGSLTTKIPVSVPAVLALSL